MLLKIDYLEVSIGISVDVEVEITTVRDINEVYIITELSYRTKVT